MTDEIIIKKVKTWLGFSGILYFQELKEIHGRLDAYWLEPVELDMIPQYAPRSVEAQEGKQVKKFLKTLDECKEWEDKDFDHQWLPILEKVIEDE